MNHMTLFSAPIAQVIEQVAALPYRRVGNRVDVLLVTSTRRRRWILPKGHVEPDLTPSQAAAQEAWEEAGVCGKVLSTSIGSYHFRKLNQDYHVEVFPMRVHELLSQWPEAAQRQRRWERIDKAIQLVHPRELATLMRQVADELI